MAEVGYLEVNGQKYVSVYGTKAKVAKEIEILRSLELTGNRHVDSLTIQKCIDANSLTCSIVCDGMTVYSRHIFPKSDKQGRARTS